MAASSTSKFMLYIFLFLLLTLTALLNPYHAEAGRTVRVGVYEAKPLAYSDKDGSAHGFFVDMLNHIAGKEQWNVQYVPGTWQEGMDRLKSDKIDLVLCIGYTAEREQYMDFPKEYLLLNWGVLYRPKGSQITSLLELEGKSVSALKGDVYLTGFLELARQFNVHVKIQEVDQYAKVFKAVESGEVAAGIAGNLYGILNENGRLAEQSPVIFSPIKVGYAVNEGKNGDLITVLDRYIAEMKADKASIYHRELEHVLGTKGNKIPKEAYWVVFVSFAALLLAIAWNIILKRQVKTKTEHLETEIAERKETENLLIKEKSLLRSVLDSMGDVVYFKDCNGVYIGCNKAAEKFIGLPEKEQIGKTDFDLLDHDSAVSATKHDQKVIADGIPVHIEEQVNSLTAGTLVLDTVKAPIIGLDGQPIGLVGISRDITERKNSGAELYRLNRELRAISNCTQVLIRAVEEKTLLDEICHIVCEEAGYRMAWVGYAENDAEKNVRPIAWAGAEDGYLANCQISWADTERGRGPTGTAIRNSEFVYTQDLANDLCMGPWQEKALQREYCSSIALPLKDKSGIAFGAFTIYSSEINAFTSDEIRLLEELADDLAFGIIVLRDRAKQKQAMVALREAQAVLQIAMDCSPAGIAIADAPDGKLRYVNDAGLLIRGSDRHSVVNGVGIDQYVANWQLLDLDGRQLRTEEVPLARAIMFGETNSRELIIRDADKVDHIVIANAAPIRDESGNVISGIVVFTDITENKQAELALKQSERDLLLMAESMPQIVWITRPDGWNLYFNQQWMDYTGLTLEESMGHDWNKPFHPDDQQRAWNAWENATRNLDTYSLECRLRRADGEYRWWLIRGVPAMDEHGTILKWFGTCTDIDELKKNEDKLLEAKSAAESANRTKSQFLANMSHEIRTPMNGIIAVSQLLQMTELNEEQREYTDLLMTSGKNLLQLITDILDLSRIEAGGVTLEATEFDLSTEMTATVRMFSQLAKAKGLELNLHINPDVPLRLTSDTLRLRQIITNLIGNAIKFTNEGMILLHISKEAEDDQCATLRFSVRDSGIGVSQDNVGKIFESFTQADNSTSIKYGGTGLGLSIARHLTELMGGSVGVESSEGQGSDFWFTAVLQKQTKSLDIPAPETAVQASKTNSINIRILLVEDDEANQVAFSRLLSKSSHQVVIAENGREALRLLEEKDFDLVLMDCRMPLMDGYEATAAIRDQSSKVRNHAIPIIALTANAFREDRQKCLDAGMDDYLSKPIDLAILLEMIEKWVKL